MSAKYQWIVIAPLCLLVTAGLVYAQNSTPVSQQGPVLWWTMTNLLSPSDLKAIWEDDSLHRVRYQQAVEEGHRTPLPEEDLDRLISFWDGDSTPELFPLWRVFNAYSTHFFEVEPVVLEQMEQELLHHGFEQETAVRIMSAAREQLELSQQIAQELRDDSRRFVEVQRQAVQAIGVTGVKTAVAAEDIVTLAVAASESPQRVGSWMAAWRRSPTQETIVPILRDLNRELSPAEWDLFRSFLFHHIAPQVSTIDFARENPS